LNSVDGEIANAMPCPPRVGVSGTMANTKFVENERDLELLGKDDLKWKGNGKKA
jgi:hypothetical protein